MHYIEVYFCQQSEFGDSADSSSKQNFHDKTEFYLKTLSAVHTFGKPWISIAFFSFSSSKVFVAGGTTN